MWFVNTGTFTDFGEIIEPENLTISDGKKPTETDYFNALQGLGFTNFNGDLESLARGHSTPMYIALMELNHVTSGGEISEILQSSLCVVNITQWTRSHPVRELPIGTQVFSQISR